MKYKFILLFLFLFMIIPLVNSSILDQHVVVSERGLEESSTSPIAQQILPYKDYFIACNEYTDISILNYFEKSCDSTGFFGRIGCLFKFDIGKQYKVTHSPQAFLRALDVANAEPDPIKRAKYIACSYGIGTHGVQDSIMHNHEVPLAIEKTFLWNGLVHSPDEIQSKNMFTNARDRAYTRQVLDLEPEITPFFEKTFQQDPAFAKVKIAPMMVFFKGQVQQNSEYRLGFQAFFALPSLIYWFVGILFLISIALFGLMIRRIRDGEISIVIIFTGIFSLILLSLVILAVYGLFTSSAWAIWEVLSQILFSGWAYLFGLICIIPAGWIIYDFIKKADKKNRIADIFVALFLILIGIAFFNMAHGLVSGNEEQIFKMQIAGTKSLLTTGVNYIKTIEDPSGFQALKDAEAKGSGVRTLYTGSLIILLAGIVYFALRKKR